MSESFKPNIYPIIYWALAFGVTAGVALFILQLLANYITIVWFPVFILGLAWGAYRNYQQQKKAWQTRAGVPATPQSPGAEIRQAVKDIADASKELFNQEAAPAVPAPEAPAPEAPAAPVQEMPAVTPEPPTTETQPPQNNS